MLLRIDHLLDRPVSGLAGGDRQRVALGRAIIRRPKAFLMDEPLGTLDAEFRDLMVRELRELHNRIEATTVYVTHDQLEAMAMADKIAVMSNGLIEQFGTPQEIYDRPASMFVADFIGSPPMNFLPFHARPAKGARSHPARRRDCRRAGNREDIATPATWRSASGPSMSASTTIAAPRPARRGLRRRISRHHADRDGRDRARHHQGACSRPAVVAIGETVGLRFDARAAVDLRQTGGRAAPRFTHPADALAGGAHG